MFYKNAMNIDFFLTAYAFLEGIYGEFLRRIPGGVLDKKF